MTTPRRRAPDLRVGHVDLRQLQFGPGRGDTAGLRFDDLGPVDGDVLFGVVEAGLAEGGRGLQPSRRFSSWRARLELGLGGRQLGAGLASRPPGRASARRSGLSSRDHLAGSTRSPTSTSEGLDRRLDLRRDLAGLARHQAAEHRHGLGQRLARHPVDAHQGAVVLGLRRCRRGPPSGKQQRQANAKSWRCRRQGLPYYPRQSKIARRLRRRQIVVALPALRAAVYA